MPQPESNDWNSPRVSPKSGAVLAPLRSLGFAPGSVVEVIGSTFDYNERVYSGRRAAFTGNSHHEQMIAARKTSQR
jgi:hypothetical protein